MVVSDIFPSNTRPASQHDTERPITCRSGGGVDAGWRLATAARAGAAALRRQTIKPNGEAVCRTAADGGSGAAAVALTLPGAATLPPGIAVAFKSMAKPAVAGFSRCGVSCMALLHSSELQSAYVGGAGTFASPPGGQLWAGCGFFCGCRGGQVAGGLGYLARAHMCAVVERQGGGILSCVGARLVAAAVQLVVLGTRALTYLLCHILSHPAQRTGRDAGVAECLGVVPRLPIWCL